MNPTEGQRETEKVMKALRERHVAMRPRWYFVLRTVLLVLLFVVIAAYLLFHTSLVYHRIQRGGGGLLPSFGWQGIQKIVFLFPWILAILGMLLIVLFALLMSRKTRAFRLPILTTVLTVLVLITGLGVVIAMTPLQDAVHRFVEKNHLTAVDQLYRSASDEQGQVLIGTLSRVQPGRFTLTTREGMSVEVIVAESTKCLEHYVPKNDDTVLVIGKRQGNVFAAEGVEKIEGLFHEDIMEEVREHQLGLEEE